MAQDRSPGLRVALDDHASSLARAAPRATCRTAVVEIWIDEAQEFEEKYLLVLSSENGPGFEQLEKTLARESNLPPCHTLVPAFQPGIFVGFHVIKVTGDGHIIERFVANDQITNGFDVNKDPVGGGVLLGYKFAPWSNNIAVAPFASVDWPNISVNQTFANGSFLGTTSKVSATAGVKIGPQFQNVWFYGIAGVGLLNETLKVNFIPVASTKGANVAGGTVGAGFAYTLPNFARRVSLFAECQHTWWQDAHFNTPAASPLFNYTFKREDDVVKVGFMVSFGAPPPTASPSYPVKAPVK
jgi:hypothetical protein